MATSCIYIIRSVINKDKSYIGSSVDFNKRKLRHINELSSNKHPNKILQNHVNKYGIEDLYFEVVENILNKSDLVVREQYYIDTISPSFNICKKAYSLLGTKRTDEQKMKLAEAASKRVWTDESRLKLSNAKKGSAFSGTTYRGGSKKGRKFKVTVPFSEERRLKNSMMAKLNYTNRLDRTGTKQSKETIEKRRISMIGKNLGQRRSMDFCSQQSIRMTGRKRGKYKKNIAA